MEDKNIIINKYAVALANMIQSFISMSSTMDSDMEQNLAIIKTLDILMESIRSQATVLQNELDNYGG